MGLDLYLYKVAKEEDIKNNTETVYIELGSKDEKELEEHGFKLHTASVECYDFEKYGFPQDKWTWMYSEYVDNKATVAFSNNVTGENVTMDLDKCPKKMVDIKQLYVYKDELGYQRKDMTDDFYYRWCNCTDDVNEMKSFITRVSELEEICKTAEHPEIFRKEFIEPFVEGETVFYISF